MTKIRRWGQAPLDFRNKNSGNVSKILAYINLLTEERCYIAAAKKKNLEAGRIPKCVNHFGEFIDEIIMVKEL